MSQQRKVLVFGATGLQGGAVAAALLAQGHEVIGVTRNTTSEKAKALENKGANLVEGSLNNADQLIETMKTVDTVFALTSPYEEGAQMEIQQGTTLAKAAQSANVGHLVFSSVSDADKNTGIPHFDSKYAVEQKIAELGIPYTIIAPVYFMENLISPWNMDNIKSGKVSMALPEGVKIQQIAVEDIAQFAAAAITGREQYFNRRINIAGDELTGKEMVEQLTAITGKEFVYEGFSPEMIKATMPDLAIMFEWFDRVGYSADFTRLKEDFPDVSTTRFESFAKNQNWEFLN